MGHHIDDQNRFQSDKHPETPANRIRMNLENPKSLRALVACAEDHRGDDPEFADDLMTCLRTIHGDEAIERATHPIMLIYSGGQISNESRMKIEQFLKSKSAHRVNVMEVETADVGIPDGKRARCDECRTYYPVSKINTCDECSSQLCATCGIPARLVHPHSDMGTS